MKRNTVTLHAYCVVENIWYCVFIFVINGDNNILFMINEHILKKKYVVMIFFLSTLIFVTNVRICNVFSQSGHSSFIKADQIFQNKNVKWEPGEL